MIGIQDFWLFLAAGLLLNVTPGPDMALIAARSASGGARAGVAAALGVAAGCFVHIAAAAAGVSAVLAASATAFTVLKWVGAGYLVYIGLAMLLAARGSAPAPAGEAPGASASLRSAFRQGFLTNVLNPKVALFFLAFLPQFIDAAAPSKVAAFIVLGLVFNLTGTAWNLAVAWGAGRLAQTTPVAATRQWLERLLGAMFVGFGVRLALSERP